MRAPTNPAIALIQRLRLRAVSVWADGDGKVHIWPVIAPEDRELLRENKPAVAMWLRQYAADLLPDDETIGHWQAEAGGGTCTP